MARAQLYPGANRAHWYADKYPGAAMNVNTVCLHSTEGTSLPPYDGGAMAPNFTGVPDFARRRLAWYQHFPVEMSSRALRNLAGGVETNTLNVTQVELVGTTDPAAHRRWGSVPHIYWPEAPDWALEDVGRFVLWMNREHGVPLKAPKLWLPYPASAGASRARLSQASWRAFSGVLAHQHVPENTHGDVLLDIDKVLSVVGGEPATRPTVKSTIQVNKLNPDRGPHGPWPLADDWVIGPDAGERASWVDGTESPDAMALVNAWRREFAPTGEAYFGKPSSPVDAAFVARAKKWQAAVKLPATGYLGAADWAVADTR